MAKATAKIMLKLLVDKNSNKVLFAEAGKDFIDFLFGLLELPIGSIMSLLVEHGMEDGCGSLGRVYKSVKSFDNNYLQQSQHTKESLLRPKISPSTPKQSPLSMHLAYKHYEVPSSGSFQFGSNVVNQNGFGLGFASPSPSGFNSPRVEEVEGYVKGVVTYMVMDDLEVKPMSTISSIALLNTFGIKDTACLEEKTVEVDIKMGLRLLKTSLESITVLTDLFLPKIIVGPTEYHNQNFRLVIN